MKHSRLTTFLSRRYYRRSFPNVNAVQGNFHDFKSRSNDGPQFVEEMQFKPLYRHALKALLKRDGVEIPFHEGQQINDYTQFPYTPIRLDARYGMPKVDLKRNDKDFESYERGDSSVLGRDSLPPKYTTTGVLGQMAVNSLERLASTGQAFTLAVNFNAPHPPMISTSRYLDYYWKNRKRLYVTPSYRDKLSNTPYQDDNARTKMLKAGYPYNEREPLQELTAVYYGMIEGESVGECGFQVARAL